MSDKKSLITRIRDILMKSVVLILFLIIFTVTSPLFAGKLDRARQEVKNGPSPSSNTSPRSRRSTFESSPFKSSSSNFPSSFNNFDVNKKERNGFGTLLGYIFLTPFYVPHFALDDSFSHNGHFNGAPYKYNKKGYLIIDRDEEEIESPSLGTKDLNRVSFSLYMEDSYDFDGVNRASVGALFDTSTRVGLETMWTHFYEKTGTGSDSFIIFDANLVFRFAQNEYAQFYVGGGGRVLIDKKVDSSGINATYFVNIYPARPISLSFSIDVGTLGKAFYLQQKSKVGAVFWSLELYVGYDYLRIGSVRFLGPMAGLQIWF